MDNQCRLEIIKLHSFFTKWFNGTLPETEESFSPTEILSPTFTMVDPQGNIINRLILINKLKELYGKRLDFYIVIEDDIEFRELENDLYLVIYTEQHITNDNRKRRRSSAIFKRYNENLLWEFVQETWLENPIV